MKTRQEELLSAFDNTINIADYSVVRLVNDNELEDKPDAKGLTPLMKAVQGAHPNYALQVVQKLILQGAKADRKFPNGQTILEVAKQRATFSNQFDKAASRGITKLIEQARQIQDKSRRKDEVEGMINQLLALESLKVTFDNTVNLPDYSAFRLVRDNAIPDEPDDQGLTPLMKAVQGSHPFYALQIVEQLLLQGARADRKFPNGLTLLEVAKQRAAASNQFEKSGTRGIFKLIEQARQIQDKSKRKDEVEQMIKQLLDQESIKVSFDNTINLPDYSAFRLVKDNKIPDEPDDQGLTPLMKAVQGAEPFYAAQVVELLLKNGASVDREFPNGTTMLEVVRERGSQVNQFQIEDTKKMVKLIEEAYKAQNVQDKPKAAKPLEQNTTSRPGAIKHSMTRRQEMAAKMTKSKIDTQDKKTTKDKNTKPKK